MTSVALLSQSVDLRPLAALLRASDGSLVPSLWPDPTALHAEVAVCWDPPRGIYAQMPGLRLVHSIAAGVDNVVDGQAIGALPVCRVVDTALSRGMLEYVLWGVLLFHRRFDEAMRAQDAQCWSRPRQQPARTCRVGVMGLGEVGTPVAEGLSRMGYSVSGWARSARELPGVRCLHDEEGLDLLLAQTDILVCLLPLTTRTRGILSARTFDRLPRGAALIHCGRGEHLVEDDLLAAVTSGQLRGAVVDVFAQEPLRVGHPLWQAPGVFVTPHMATMASFDVVARQIADNVRRLRTGEPLRGLVNVTRGY